VGRRGSVTQARFTELCLRKPSLDSRVRCRQRQDFRTMPERLCSAPGEVSKQTLKSTDMKVLVVVASGLHLGYLGCYGNLWIETPCLDRLAAEGIVFDQHYADCPASNFRTSWTGRYCFPGLDGGDDSHDP